MGNAKNTVSKIYPEKLLGILRGMMDQKTDTYKLFTFIEGIKQRFKKRKKTPGPNKSRSLAFTVLCAILIGLFGIYWPQQRIPQQHDSMMDQPQESDIALFDALDQPTPMEPTQAQQEALSSNSKFSVEVHTPKNRIPKERAAYDALMRQDFPKAIQLYKNLATESPLEEASLYNLAIAFQKTGSTTEALAIYKKILQKNPHHASAENNLLAIEMLKNPEDAIAKLNVLIKKNPQAPFFNAQKAKALSSMGKPEAAISAMEQAVRSAPYDPLLLYNLAVLYDKAGSRSAAFNTYQRALMLLRKNPTAAQRLPQEIIIKRLNILMPKRAKRA